MIELSEEAKQARRDYKREWNKRNPEKQKEYDARHWEKLARKAAGYDYEIKKGVHGHSFYVEFSKTAIPNTILVDDIIRVLPKEIGEALRSVFDMIVSEPDILQRCKKYLSELDEFFEDAPLPLPEAQIVVLENYPHDVIESVFDISFEYKAYRGHGTLRLFNSLFRISDFTFALNLVPLVSISDDGKVFKFK